MKSSTNTSKPADNNGGLDPKHLIPAAAGTGETDASMSLMMATMTHNTILGNMSSMLESANNLLVNGTGGITKVTANVGRNIKDAAG